MNTESSGLIILAGSSLTGMIVLLSKGSLRLQKPEGNFISWVYNLLNLFILIILTPLTGVFLLKNITALLQFLQIPVDNASAAEFIQRCGLILFAVGTILVCWGRVILWNSFRLGAVKPGSGDKLVFRGPYRLIRHPMYTGVIFINLGLALTVMSGIFLFLFILMTYSIICMIPTEEKQLKDTYGKEYEDYCQRSKKLIPFIY